MKLHKKAIALLKEIVMEEKNRKGACPASLIEGAESGSLSDDKVDAMVRYLNFRREFLRKGTGKPYREGTVDSRMSLSLNADYYREVIMPLPDLMSAVAAVLDELDYEGEADVDVIGQMAASLKEHIAKIPGLTPETKTCRVTQVALLQYMETAVRMLAISVDTLIDILAEDDAGNDGGGPERSFTITLTPPKGPIN